MSTDNLSATHDKHEIMHSMSSHRHQTEEALLPIPHSPSTGSSSIDDDGDVQSSAPICDRRSSDISVDHSGTLSAPPTPRGRAFGFWSRHRNKNQYRPTHKNNIREHKALSDWVSEYYHEDDKESRADPENGLKLASGLRRRRLEMLERDSLFFAPTAPEGPGIGPDQQILGAIVTPQRLFPEKAPRFMDFAGRTRMLIVTLTLWSLVLSLSGVVFIIYPLMSGAIDYGVILRPMFDNIWHSDEILRVATIIGQWNVPAQLIHFFLGPGGSMLTGFIGIAVSCRELGFTANRERYLRTHNPYNHAGVVCLLSQSGHTVALAGYWTIYRFAPPSMNQICCWFCRVIPHVFAIILAYGISIHYEITEIMMPLSVLVSTVGIALSLIFIFIVRDIAEVLPSDAYYCRSFLKPDPVNISLQAIFLSGYVWRHIFALSWLFAFKYFWIANLPEVQYVLKAPLPIRNSYTLFLGGDFLGLYLLPFVCDKVVGYGFSRLDLQVLILIPHFVVNIFNHAGLDIGLYTHGALTLIATVLIISIWITCREYETDRFGFCPAGLFASEERLHVIASYIPTAMVPLWCTSLREQEKIQKKYYEWNIMREPPSVVAKKNAQYQDWLKKKRYAEREKMREVEERIERVYA